MDFERSTQARSWLFDKKSLYQCREKVISDQASARKADGSPKVRKFASGFGKRQAAGSTTDSTTGGSRSPSHRSCEPVELIWDQSSLTSNEQAILVRFHAHQMSMLVGPTAILPSLVRGPTVLATAIMLFRRFYLSNSVLDFSPRRMAVAAAFLASKVEDQKVESDALEHATDMIRQKVRGAPLCRDELTYVTVEEIEVAERDLMDGINYEMRCHHPFNAIRILAGEVEKFLVRDEDPLCFTFETVFERRQPVNDSSSPRGVIHICDEDFHEGIEERAMLVAQNAMLFSDVIFLHPPGQIAFAAVAMSIHDGHNSVGLPLILRTYLRDRFVSKTEDELLAFEDQVSAIADLLRDSPVMDMTMIAMSRNSLVSDRVVTQQADELRRVFLKVTSITCRAKPVEQSACTFGQKRKFPEPTFLSPGGPSYRKVVKVTPTKL